jgi:antitoxin component of MazEF toxin-antitoxin module
MLQKVIQVGNSYAITIPKDFVEQTNLKVGQKVQVDGNILTKTLTVQSVDTVVEKQEVLTPEFLRWLKKFNAQYGTALKELAGK